MKKKLEKLKMPEKRSDELDLSSLDEGAPSEDPMGDEELPQDPQAEDQSAPGPLDHVDDEELMAEVQKRGLLSQLEGGEEQAQADGQMDYGMDQK